MASTGLAGPFMIDMDMGFALAAVDRLLGGPGRIPSERHEPTPIEADLIARVVGPSSPRPERGLVAPPDPRRLRHRDRPSRRSCSASPRRPKSWPCMTYEVRFAGQTAPMTICYPYAIARAAAAETGRHDVVRPAPCRPAGNSAVRDVLETEVRSVEIPVSASFRAVDIPVEALSELRPGDVIRFDERFDEPVLVAVSDQAQAWAIPGRVGDRVALRLVTPLEPTEA